MFFSEMEKPKKICIAVSVFYAVMVIIGLSIAFSKTGVKTTITSCPDPPSLENGFINGSDYLPGQKVIFGCFVGYKMYSDNGSNERILQCGENGEWIGETPICQIINCSTPIPPSNGHINGIDYSYGQNITITCSRGYRILMNGEYLINDAKTENSITLQCSETGDWTGTIPTCEAISCPSPESVYNARIKNNFDAYHFGMKVFYECERGYEYLSGDLERTCTENGIWSGYEPVCKPISCPSPESVYNARIQNNFDAYHFGMKVFYECDRGYEYLSGDLERTCTENGIWSGYEPVCKRHVDYNDFHNERSSSGGSSIRNFSYSIFCLVIILSLHFFQ